MQFWPESEISVIKCLKVAGHPACFAACLCVEIEWEICHVNLSLPSKSMAAIAPKI